jgi:hypothetical protein
MLMLLALCREDVDAGSLNCRATGRCVIVVVLTETVMVVLLITHHHHGAADQYRN